MTGKIDLHAHTSASDGTFSPGDLVRFASAKGVTTIAITDHDTVDGIDEALESGRNCGVRVIPGIEFSVDYPHGTFHLLGYHFDHANRSLIEECRSLNRMRETRAYRIIEDLEKNGIRIPREEVEIEARNGTIGRPHIARMMVRHGYARNIDEVFENYLVKGKPGYVRKERIELRRAMALLSEAGGTAVIAHPITLNFENFSVFEDILKDFVRSGISGIEAYSYMHNPEQVEDFCRLAEKLGLFVTGGSDFHGDKDQKLGQYSDREIIPPVLLERMDSLLSRKR